MSIRDKKKLSVFRSTLGVALVLVFVKIVGFIKQAVIAAHFGTGLEMDAYLMVFDFVVEIGAVVFSSLSVSFLNYYVLFAKNRIKKEKDEFVINVLYTFVPVALILTCIVIACSKPLSFLLAPGFSVQEKLIVERYLRIMSIALCSTCCGNIFTSVLEAEKDFIPGKLSGLLQSAIIIAGCLLFSPYLGIDSLIYSYLTYCVVQNLYLFIKSLKYIKYRPIKYKYNSAIGKILKLSCPLFVSNAVVQINAMVDKAVTSGLGSGGVSALSYGYFIFSSIHSIIIGGSNGVIFSHFSSYIAENNIGALKKLLKDSINVIMLVMAPIVIFLCFNAKLAVKFLFQRGQFDDKSVLLTSGAVAAYSAGLLFIGVKDTLIRLFYAYQNTKIPMRNGMISVAINILLSITLSKYLGVWGVAFASSISHGIGLVLILLSVKMYINNYGEIIERKIWGNLIIAGCIAAFFMLFIGSLMIKQNLLIQLLINAAALFGMYVLILIITKCKYVLWVLERIGRKEK